jgi:hypothetical protein
MMVTSFPSRRSAAAEARPITPAPITAIRRGFVPTISFIIDVRTLAELVRSDETISSTPADTCRAKSGNCAAHGQPDGLWKTGIFVTGVTASIDKRLALSKGIFSRA